jgi:peroxiredoxin Q/BCP
MARAGTLRAGDRAPDFEAETQTGERVRLSDYLARGPVVLYFYPKAFTPGCTKESCHFRDLAAEFQAAGATVLGVSADPPERQAAFDRRYGLGLTLLSDRDRSVARAYGVRRAGPLFNRRTTFVIGADGRILDVIASELNMEVHADRALEALRRAGTGPGDDATRRASTP